MAIKKTGRAPVLLIILDGWGRAPHQQKNPIQLAKTPVMKKLWDEHPHTTLAASGSAVGLLPNQDGNSEAGHMNIGAGRIVEQDILRISKSIKKGTFFKNAAFEQAARHVKENNSNLHLLGLLSDENSGHSNPEHLQALLKFYRKEKVPRVYLHLFTDGRDTPKYSAVNFINKLEKTLKPNEKIVTLLGRLYLDRKKNWSRTKLAYNTLLFGAKKKFYSAEEAIQEAYKSGESDEFITPRIILDADNNSPRIKDNDAIIFFNLRSDRARQLTKPFVQSQFNKLNPNSFRRSKVLKNIIFVAMTDFGPDLENILTAYPSEDIEGTLPMALSELRQLYIAESEKFAHITYFLNGGYTHSVGGEVRINIPSPDVDSYDKTPEMSAYKIVKKVLSSLQKNEYDFIGINFANADMVGHTGNLEACIKAVETIDDCIGRLYKEIKKQKGLMIITADHGNIEEIINSETGEVDTEHSNNPVPFIIASPRKFSVKKLPRGVLGNVAPTILDLLGIEKPYQMSCTSLFKKKN